MSAYAIPSRESDAGPDERIPESKPEERDFLDICLDANWSIRNALRSDSIFMKRANLLVATSELRLALEKLG